MRYSCLLIEDSQVQARVIAAFLEGLGWNVTTAFNLKSALNVMTQGQVELCLSDLILPDAPLMDGIAKLKAAAPNMLIAAMTAGSGRINWRQALAQARHEGADFLLPKPFTQARLKIITDEVTYRIKEGKRRPQILVVDDSKTVRSFCAKALIDADFRVIEAETFDQAYSQIDVLDLDAIVLDMFMPGMPVLQNLPLLRDKLPGVGLVCISGVPDKKDQALRSALSAGADLALAKPFTAEDLVMAVKKASLVASTKLLEEFKAA